MIYIINQPWRGRGEQLGDYLVRLLTQDEPRFERFRACVAFVRSGGVLRLAPALETFMARGGEVEMVVGVDEGITTRQALELVMKFSTTAYVFHNPVATFHPKMYLFEIPGRLATVFIGSNNLTAGGLYTNYEASLGIEFDLTVAEEQKAYSETLAIFLNARDTITGNAKVLDEAVLAELVNGRKVSDETRLRRRIRTAERKEGQEDGLFPRIPVPPPPSIAPHLNALIPKVELKVDDDTETIATYGSWRIFVMRMGERDTRQDPGFSRDIYIPIAARNFDSAFWDWPGAFAARSRRTGGNYLERRLDMLVRPVTGELQIVEGVRLYGYDIKHEFRLNCSRLVKGTSPGDLLVIQKWPVPLYFQGHPYQFEASVLSTDHPMYATYAQECRYEIRNSQKRWGYI